MKKINICSKLLFHKILIKNTIFRKLCLENKYTVDILYVLRHNYCMHKYLYTIITNDFISICVFRDNILF